MQFIYTIYIFCQANVNLLQHLLSMTIKLAHTNVFPAGLLSEFDSIDKTDPNCVLIGDAAEKFSYQNLNKAFRILGNLDNPLLLSLGQG